MSIHSKLVRFQQGRRLMCNLYSITPNQAAIGQAADMPKSTKMTNADFPQCLLLVGWSRLSGPMAHVCN